MLSRKRAGCDGEVLPIELVDAAIERIGR